MEKKQYVKPSMKVFEIEIPKIICASGDDPVGYIPGQQPDDKHLA